MRTCAECSPFRTVRDDIKGDAVLNVPHLDIRLVKVRADGFGLLRGHIGNDLQLLFLLAGYDARSGGFQTLHVIRVGYDDRLVNCE